ncbi:DUF885 domain-containing protein [Brumicola nitratireducens]|uniref:Lipoprotein n=1 Tax=Glaciecola nitratireducens (strain JCM 12485 / KCTC 12276 / FR1064) TaxID=1085623 RepID=G4QET4_GLANF|nr:DUF885 domain-containing protein [Glaciecola nitratireducens]AEP28197.1 hypothetical protein GNIT_0042 [Glaciecola nitratireducens FR1064]
MKKRFYSIALAVSVALAVGACGSTTPPTVEQASTKTEMLQNQASAQLIKLLDDIWQYELSTSPGMAKSRGQKPKRALSDISIAALNSEAMQYQTFLTALEEVDTAQLTDSENITLLMQKYRIQNYVDMHKFKEYRVPITSEYGFHSGLGRQASNTSIKNAEQLKDYMMLLSEMPDHFSQQIAYMQEGMQVGQVQPKVVLRGYEESVLAFIAQTPDESPFYQAFEKMPEELKTAQNMQAAEAAIAKVSESYQQFYDFLTNDYIPMAKQDISVKTWPAGEAFYQNRIKYYTTTDMTAEEIHQLGLSEVARIRAEMQTIVDELEFDGNINQFIEFLRTDPRFYAQTPEDLLITASYIAKKMDAQLPKLFKKLPRTPYGVAPVPESIAPKYTTGRYVSPSSDDQPGYYWVNTYALDKRPLYALPALTLHEAVPGHHLQISLAAEMTELPEVRRSTYISAFGEGWGLYSEYLGLEVGIYTDPYDNFGRLSYEMWRACRLVVDTGMHMFGWSRDKALNYMLENTALSEHNVRTEIDRYISWPAQALSYKIGEIKIKQLRAEAEERLGDKFDVREFHDAVLAHGSVPLFVLEQNIQRFIEQKSTPVKGN